MKEMFSTQEIMCPAFRKRLVMYTGEESLKSIFFYLQTYKFALLKHGIKDSETYEFWYFHEFVKNRFGFSESTAGWKNMIVADYLGFKGDMKTWCWEDFFEREKEMNIEDHKASIKYFFELFDEFYALSLKEYMQIVEDWENR